MIDLTAEKYARIVYTMYVALCSEGFNADQALEVLTSMIRGGVKFS